MSVKSKVTPPKVFLKSVKGRPRVVECCRDLAEAMQKDGLVIKEPLIADGKFRNVDAVGDAPKSKKAWYWIAPSGRYAAYGHHRPDVNKRWKWSNNHRSAFSDEELAAFRKQLKKARSITERKEAEAFKVCVKRATHIWAHARTPDVDHPYLVRKLIDPVGIKQFKEDLVVPVLGADGRFRGLQFIKPNGLHDKVYLKGTRKRGSWFALGQSICDRAIICEGYATAVSIFAATNIPTICAFDAGNLEYVADMLRRQHPRATITIAGDNDQATERSDGRNPGVDAATRAARVIDGYLSIPMFDANHSGLTDFNDLARVKGLAEVRSAIDAAQFIGSWPPPSHTSADPHTDVANAQRLIKAYGGQLLYARGRGWLYFDPPWKPDAQAAERLSVGLGLLIRREADHLREQVLACTLADERVRLQQAETELRAWAKKSESSGKINAAVKTASSLLAVPGGTLDSNTSLLSFRNGILDINARIFRAHTPSDHVSLRCGCDHDPTAKAPRWKEFLHEVFPNKALIDFLQCALGYALLGRQHEHIILLFHGDGENGKGTLINALLRALGDYAITAPSNLLVAARGERHPTELAMLSGKRLVVHGETGSNATIDSAKLKVLTGNDPIAARGMRKDFINFKPSHLLILHTNHLLRVNDSSHGFWRRVKVVPFEVRFSGKKRERGLEDRLSNEAPGIVNWLLAGLRRYKTHGLIVPPAVKIATRNYRQGEDQIGKFIKARCVKEASTNTIFSDLYESYKEWLKCQIDAEHLSEREFGQQLSVRGVKAGKSNGKRVRRGLLLR